MNEMFKIKNNTKININNIIIRSEYIFEIKNIDYIDDYNFVINIKFIEPTNVIIIKIINKFSQHENFDILIDSINSESPKIINSSFKLVLDLEEHIFKIPKIIHQSYTNNVKPKLYKATNSWKFMNLNYTYKYWNDDECYNFILCNFNKDVLDAYNLLYAGAYKSDIFRLCVLYIYGGIWADISSVCEETLDLVIENNLDLIIVKDNPAQIIYGNIYQAFIITHEKNEIIKYILDFTVDRVLNNYNFNRIYPFLKNEAIAVTGPTVFAMALNTLLCRDPIKIFNDIYISHNSKNIQLLEHQGGKIIKQNKHIIRTKYENYLNDRTNEHYSSLFSKGYVYKKKVIDRFISSDASNLYQIWIQDEFVTKNMYYYIQKVKDMYSNMNYTLLTNDKIVELIKNDIEFPNLFEIYNKLKPFAYKSDIIRLYILYKKGGIYLDIDFICYQSIEDLYNNHDLTVVTDICENNIVNSLICCKKGNLFIKTLLLKIIDNVTNEITLSNDLELTGPVVFGNVFSNYYDISKPFCDGVYIKKNDKINIMTYKFDFPPPTGSYINSSKEINVKGNELSVKCLNINGKWIKNIVKFIIDDSLDNIDGNIINNTEYKYTQTDGSGVVFSKHYKKFYFVSKYPKYNDEVIVLNGNNFAHLFNTNNIYN